MGNGASGAQEIPGDSLTADGWESFRGSHPELSAHVTRFMRAVAKDAPTDILAYAQTFLGQETSNQGQTLNKIRSSAPESIRIIHFNDVYHPEKGAAARFATA